MKTTMDLLDAIENTEMQGPNGEVTDLGEYVVALSELESGAGDAKQLGYRIVDDVGFTEERIFRIWGELDEETKQRLWNLGIAGKLTEADFEIR